jgi:hypothetical protein
MIKIKGVGGRWLTRADAEEFLASVAARGADAWAACVGIPASQVEFVEEGVAAPSIEIRTAYHQAVPTRSRWVENDGQWEKITLPAQEAYWSAEAYDNLGNYIVGAEGATEADARRAVEAKLASVKEVE